MRIVSGISLAAVLLGVGVQTAVAQSELGPDRWYWGAEGGALLWKTPTQAKTRTAPFAGVNWFITKRQVALSLGFDQYFFPSYASTSITNASSATGATTVAFDRGQRFSAMLYAMPGQGLLRLDLGVGFVINNITNAQPTGTGSQAELDAATQSVKSLRTAAMFQAAVGVHYVMGRAMVYGEYRFNPGSDNYLIPIEQHTIAGGIRYAFSSSHTEVTTEQ